MAVVESRDVADASKLVLFILAVYSEFEVTVVSICTQNVWNYQGRECFKDV